MNSWVLRGGLSILVWTLPSLLPELVASGPTASGWRVSPAFAGGTINRMLRWSGWGWSDGYHACQPRPVEMRDALPPLGSLSLQRVAAEPRLLVDPAPPVAPHLRSAWPEAVPSLVESFSAGAAAAPDGGHAPYPGHVPYSGESILTPAPAEGPWQQAAPSSGPPSAAGLREADPQGETSLRPYRSAVPQRPSVETGSASGPAPADPLVDPLVGPAEESEPSGLDRLGREADRDAAELIPRPRRSLEDDADWDLETLLP